MRNQTRNSEVLQSFMTYCNLHPNERFWQALRNWSGKAFLYASTHQAQEFKNPEDSMTVYLNLEETFYWTTKDGQ